MAFETERLPGGMTDRGSCPKCGGTGASMDRPGVPLCDRCKGTGVDTPPTAFNKQSSRQ